MTSAVSLELHLQLPNTLALKLLEASVRSSTSLEAVAVAAMQRGLQNAQIQGKKPVPIRTTAGEPLERAPSSPRRIQPEKAAAYGEKVRHYDVVNPLSDDYSSYTNKDRLRLLRLVMKVALSQKIGTRYSVPDLFTDKAWKSMTKSMHLSVGRTVAQAVHYNGSDVRSDKARIVALPRLTGRPSVYVTEAYSG